MKNSIILFGLCLLAGFTHGQDTIYFSNSSFEGRAGHSQVPEGWVYRGFANETPPDLLPFGANTYFPFYSTAGKQINSSTWGFGVSLPPVDGHTYLGMVTRDNRTVEALSQKLARPLAAGKCYILTISLASSPSYYSISRHSGQPANFAAPTKLMIHNIDQTGSPRELLAQSPPIDHPVWRTYTLILRPLNRAKRIQLTAWYGIDSLANGNLLIDHLSPLSACACAKKDQYPQIDTFTYSPPTSREQAREVASKQAAQIRFSTQGAPTNVQLFRYGGRRAAHANPHWFFCRKALSAYPVTIEVAINAAEPATRRALRKWLRVNLRKLPQVKLRRIIRYTPEQSVAWPVPPDTNGIAIRFR